MSVLQRVVERYRTPVALAILVLTVVPAFAQETTLHARFVAIEEVARITPGRALQQLAQIEAEARQGSPAELAEFLIASADTQHGLGKHALAVELCDQAIAIGRRLRNDDILARALLSKAYALFSLDHAAASHQLVWQAEKLAAKSKDARLRVLSMISSGEAFVEDGNFPAALVKLQGATNVARESKDPILVVISLRSLAILYDRMREFDKGFELLEEAIAAAKRANSEGRLALLKSTEYALAMDSNQIERALQAELSALALQRKLGAEPMIGISLVNLADCYLKLRDFDNALSYARQALEQSRTLNDQGLAATARINIGQAYLAMGRLAEGKKYAEEGLAWFDKSGNKPDLQVALGEYADALSRAGDAAAAVAAYQRERTLLNELFEKRRQKAMTELQEQYEAERKQRQIELLRQENQVKSIEIDNRRLQQRVWWLLAVVMALASVVVAILYRKVRRANVQLEIRNNELKQQSACDPMTGLYNRRHFQEFMRAQGAAIQRAAALDPETAGAIFLLDVDHFKSINDRYGHAAGDAVLREIAGALRDILRETDMIVRWGGEEFLAFLPSVRRANLDEVARRLLAGIAGRRIDFQGTALSVQVSIGFAPFPLAPGAANMSWERTINIVDMALYLAKGHGRNRAYGVEKIASLDEASLGDIEQNMEAAWRAGRIGLSLVDGNQTVQAA